MSTTESFNITNNNKKIEDNNTEETDKESDYNIQI